MGGTGTKVKVENMRASIGNVIKEVIKTSANNKLESAASKKTTDLLKKL